MTKRKKDAPAASQDFLVLKTYVYFLYFPLQGEDLNRERKSGKGFGVANQHHMIHLVSSRQEAKSFLMPHGISMLRGPYQQQSGGVLGTLQSVKDTYEKDLKESWLAGLELVFSNFQLPVACDVIWCWEARKNCDFWKHLEEKKTTTH